ncbi:tail fiber domain-containing protein [Aurantiacibacter sp. MUD11]|uniref:tail fiber domain-containing protein n=1 Tax=Aurantiacibacter sp. MUD11 TaxID=3003265 RepID=UPI0022AA6699|nr:tail fiber domain-containing protein [Aurantiacibacter sp. MUD11]WAT17024.1 tail fiber domain-containing protein [Aurantiacibacter sp. MUD11]
MSKSAGKKRQTYIVPRLTKFGTVRALTGGSLDVGTDTGFPTGKNFQSDIRVKENIARIGEHPAGFGLYLFDYKPHFQTGGRRGRHFGVMAQEVEGIIPEAVSVAANGYLQVDYGKLGIKLH